MRVGDFSPMSAIQPLPTLGRYLTGSLRVGDPDVAGPLAVYPLFGPEPELHYVAFAQAVGTGLAIKELSGGASVNDLLVSNATEHNVLLYEGEEVLGAQQNRTFDVSVLVAPHSRLNVPVSCVEAGRWDGSRHNEDFAPAPQSAYPALRRMKNAQARMRLREGADARADQSEVWQEVDAKRARHGAAAPTGAMHDVFEHRRSSLDDLVGAVRLRPGQCGAVVALGGAINVTDHVSRPDVFGALHGPLVQGYALDALEAAEAPAPSIDAVNAWIEQALAAPVTERDGLGASRDVRFESPAAEGAALVSGTELVQLTAFASRPAGTAIRRPSRRRR